MIWTGSGRVAVVVCHAGQDGVDLGWESFQVDVVADGEHGAHFDGGVTAEQADPGVVHVGDGFEVGFEMVT